MSITLLETANRYFSNAYIAQTAASLGESEAGMGKALYVAIPTALAGLIAQVQGGNASLTQQLLLQSHTPPTRPENLPEQLFGNQLAAVTQAVIKHAGINNTSAHIILAAAATAAIDTVSRYAQEHQLNTAALVHFLQNQQVSLAATLPDGMPALTVVPTVSVTPTNDENTIVDEAADTETEAAEIETDPPVKKRWRRWPTLTAVTLGALLALYFFKGNCNK